MLAATQTERKPLSVGAQLEILRDIRAIVCADWRRAEGRGDLVEVACCRREHTISQTQIDDLTDGRGY